MKKILSAMQKAVYDYQMIAKDDRIAVGVSGGKDSLLLLKAMVKLQKFFQIPFSLVAIHINMGFKDLDTNELSSFSDCIRGEGVELITEETKLAEIIFNVRKEKNPCSLCANIRRGALNNSAKKHGCNKIALGHHSDDAIETFLLSLLYESRISTFKPVSYLDRTEITLIRPLIYVSEKKIIAASKGLPVINNPCPANKCTRRQYMKELIDKLDSNIPGSREKIFNAIAHPERNSLWEKP